ncbi:MAG: hypothetical protein IKU79_07065 [Bacteroidaceae bacterium]|jgi:glutaredoxin-related protein|nr:hypothetical protein [Bacteroidaceae bacterium]
MKKIYIMSTCPDCSELKELELGDKNIEMIDIGAHAKNLKEFLQLRDNNKYFKLVIEKGNIGIPCLVDENGDVTFSTKRILPIINCTEASNNNLPKDVEHEKQSCSIDGRGC